MDALSFSNFHISCTSILAQDDLLRIEKSVSDVAEDWGNNLKLEDLSFQPVRANALKAIVHPLESFGLGRIYIDPSIINPHTPLAQVRIVFSASVPFDAQTIASFKLLKVRGLEQLMLLVLDASRDLHCVYEFLGLPASVTEHWHLTDAPVPQNKEEDWLPKFVAELETGLSNIHVDLESASMVGRTFLIKCSHPTRFHDLFITMGISSQGAIAHLRYLPVVQGALKVTRANLAAFSESLVRVQISPTDVIQDALSANMGNLIKSRQSFLKMQNELTEQEVYMDRGKAYVRMYLDPLRKLVEKPCLTDQGVLERELQSFDAMLVDPVEESLQKARNILSTYLQLLGDSINLANIQVNIQSQEIMGRLQWIQAIIAVILVFITIVQILASSEIIVRFIKNLLY